MLKAGKSITYPIGGAQLGPARYVVADAPLGRVHFDSGRLIDLMVFIDTPLDIALARRVLRDIDLPHGWSADEAVLHAKEELTAYLDGARPLYEEFQERMRTTSDVIVDGTLGVNDVVEKIYVETEARFPSPLADE